MKDFKIEDWSLGSDAEMFLLDRETNEVINGKKFVKGSKDNPYNFDKSSPFWCTSLDGISAEFNIAPCTTSKEWNAAFEKCITYINSTLPPNLCTIHTPAVRVNPKELRTKEARNSGCTPSWSAYSLRENHPPDVSVTTLRTCCTHVHMKYKDMRFHEAAEWIKAMDLFLGVPSLIIEPMNERRMLYGTLGEMRFNSTVEYRVLSSFFSQSEELRTWVFNNTVNAINWINEGNRVSEEMHQSFEQAMATNDVDLVRMIIEENNIPMPSI